MTNRKSQILILILAKDFPFKITKPSLPVNQPEKPTLRFFTSSRMTKLQQVGKALEMGKPAGWNMWFSPVLLRY
jgi:hypothetical protein